jgi:hypothetical protein
MPYISTERVKEIRTELKAKFPDFTFSVTTENHSTVSVKILKASVNLIREDKQSESVNHFWIEETYKNDPEKRDILLAIHEIMNKGNDTMVNDGDYGNVPLFYTDLQIGTWDKPFIYIKPKVQDPKSETPEPQNVPIGKIQIIQYSEKSIAVIGDTKPIKDKLKELGGSFNFRLTCGAGWIFPISKLNALQTSLGNNF